MAVTLEFSHGGVITSGQGSMDIFAAYRADPKSKELPIHEAVRDPQSGIKEDSGVLEIVPSSSFNTGKNWTKRRCMFPSGSFVKFTFRRMRKGSGAFGASMHSIIVSPREGAALCELRVELPTDSKSSISAIYITGRFDILLPAEVKAKGLHKNAQGANDLSTFDIGAMDEFLGMRIIEKAERGRIKAKPKVLSVGGGTKALARVRRPRRIRLSD